MVRGKLSILAKVLLVLLVAWAWRVMIVSNNGTLSSTGLRSLRYFTVLSNLLCGLSALVHLIALGVKKEAPPWVLRLSYAGTVAVGVTLMVVMLFLGPLYGYGNMLEGANLWFHLVIPVLAILDHILLEQGERPTLRDSLLCSLSPLAYGLGYVGNIVINGLGQWPDTNDWYLFFHWGTPVAVGIFAAILLLTWGIACALRALGRARAKRTDGQEVVPAK